ncbi:hypothetical protein BV898_05863 [Hypsibius exemplaris]|uniref:Uncharacterized protein n=1 Tax=Hypsibius exemplaris TaxID=2072580 RepID=A0A1W0WY05_HYPEX|nr:hypothetical protein BV898_05863 [Hypsibius exemplaris]
MSGAREVVRVFVGIINKVNAAEMIQLAQKFVMLHGVQHYQGDPAPHSNGFFLTFYSEAEAETAVRRMEDAPLGEAVSGFASARVVFPDEADVAIIQRMEREMWLEPDYLTAPTNETDEDVFSLAMLMYNQLNLFERYPERKAKATQEQLEAHLEGLIYTVINHNRQHKYIFNLVSPEAVVCSVLLAHTDGFLDEAQLKHALKAQPSYACRRKFRYDVTSTVLTLPSEWQVTFDQEKLMEWAARHLDNINPWVKKIKELKIKVINPHVLQVFTESDAQRSQLIESVTKLRDDPAARYKGVRVSAVQWKVYLMYRMLPAYVEDQLFLKRMLEGSDEELAELRTCGSSPGGCGADQNAVDDMTDSFYSELAQLRNPVEFYVQRDGQNSAAAGSVRFLDLFVFTTDYRQSALKRTETIRLFNTQLDALIVTSGAQNGLILNFSAPFDALGGIVFYLVFHVEDEGYLKRTVRMVKDNHLHFIDVIQQNAGNPIKTSVQRGIGFDIEFRANECRQLVDLVQLSQLLLDLE